MNNSKPFGRSLALVAAISQAAAMFGAHTLAGQEMIRNLSQQPAFRSRGHGRNKRSGVNVKALNKMRVALGQYNYVPYGGAKEIARRALQKH